MNNESIPSTTINQSVPVGNASGFKKYLAKDLLSGFLVFLIALPLCLGISLASGYPAIAGIFTAIIGALVTTFISNSELTIKGPAAGLIVIAIGCISDFGGDGMADGVFSSVDMGAYRAALAVGLAAAVLQICFALFRAGILGEFFPTSAVHGMLAAIGVIIVIKQFPVALGVSAKGEPLEMLSEFPHYIAEANPAIATIGIVSLLIMFLWPMVKKRIPTLGVIPAPMIVLFVAVAMGAGFDLLHEHSYTLASHQYQLGDQYLVRMPDRMFGMFDFITFPDMTALQQPKAWWWVFMFFAIGSLESLLSAKAVDLLDPWKRKTNLDRDVLAVGVANLACACVGGLPMISEIVRSRANIDNGARTRFADMWHGLFLLLCVALIPTVLHRIPLAALAAMLVYTGFRLAHPSEFINAWRVGKEQLAIFATTVVAVLATDLLIGIGIGIALKMIIHIANGVPLKSMFKPYIDVEEIDDNTSLIVARQSAVFSNWIPFRRQIEQIGLVNRRNIVVDLSNAKLVDHSVMEKLEQMERDFHQEGLGFEVRGLEDLQPFSGDAHSARRRTLASVRRLTIVCEESLEDELVQHFIARGATGFTSAICSGAGRSQVASGLPRKADLVRIEFIVTPEIAETLLEFVRANIIGNHPVTVCVETVEVFRRSNFEATASDRAPVAEFGSLVDSHS